MIAQPITTIAATKRKRRKGLTEQELQHGSKLGMDSHAEITCYGRHARIMRYHDGMSHNVRPFHDSYSPMENIQCADACFAYDAEDGQTYILHHYYGLDFSDMMEDSILCTNQSRASDVIVNDVPPCFDVRGESHHALIFPKQDIELPLSLHNAISYLPVRYPTDDDLENGIDVYLTHDVPWDPTMF